MPAEPVHSLALAIAMASLLAATACSDVGPSLHQLGGSIEARGLDPRTLQQLIAGADDDGADGTDAAPLLADTLSLHVESLDSPPVAGSYSVDAETGVLRLDPLFPLEPGLAYIAQLDLPSRGPIQLRFALPPRETPEGQTSVSAVYPSGDRLPANLLRFYLHFSAPMRTGDSYRYIEIRDEKGEPILAPLLELREELWDPGAQRLTLLFDPGRIKSGLLPTRTIGGALEETRRLTLTVDSSWPDAAGRPLATRFEHSFEVAPPDTESPSVDVWSITPPRAATREPLRITLDEPLDHALMHAMITVERANGEMVMGEVGVSASETVWTLSPARPWQPGPYRIVVDVRLEDRAGNRVDRQFERDLRDPGSSVIRQGDGPPLRTLDFEISGRDR